MVQARNGLRSVGWGHSVTGPGDGPAADASDHAERDRSDKGEGKDRGGELEPHLEFHFSLLSLAASSQSIWHQL